MANTRLDDNPEFLRFQRSAKNWRRNAESIKRQLQQEKNEIVRDAYLSGFSKNAVGRIMGVGPANQDKLLADAFNEIGLDWKMVR